MTATDLPATQARRRQQTR